MSELEQLIAERKSLNEKIKKVAKGEFGAAIAGLFESEPELKNFAWLQYTHEYDDGQYPWEISTNIKVDRYRPQMSYTKTSLDTIVDAEWKKFPAWLLAELFGEDNYVIVYPDRVETLDYYN